MVEPRRVPELNRSSKKVARGKKRGAKKTEVAKPNAGSGHFRETLWFKKGLLDAKAAEERDPDDDLALGSSDSLPIEDRYLDDGSITQEVHDELTLHTGRTEMMAPMDTEAAPVEGVSEAELVAEMKGGRMPVVFALCLGTMAIVAALFLAT